MLTGNLTVKVFDILRLFIPNMFDFYEKVIEAEDVFLLRFDLWIKDIFPLRFANFLGLL